MGRSLYIVIAVLSLVWLIWADYRGWAPDTMREDECRQQAATQAATGQNPCNEQRSIRRRTYRGGK